MIGLGMRHSTPFINLFEDEDEVNVMEDNTKEIASEWLVDSGASVYVTNSKDDLNDPETTNQAVTSEAAIM